MGAPETEERDKGPRKKKSYEQLYAEKLGSLVGMGKFI